MSRLSAAATSFEETLASLGVSDAELADPADIGRRAALLAAGELVWRNHLGPSYTGKQVRELLGVGTRQAINDRVKRRRLLAVPAADGVLEFPAFQFGRGGRTLPGIREVLDVFAGAVETPYTVASWFVTREPLLERRTPAEWVRDGGPVEPVVEAARRYAERLRH